MTPIVALWAWRALVVGVAVGLAATSAYYHVFSRFSWYDDEGYVMITVRQFVDGRGLYDDVYSQYGPFYYAVRLLVLSVLQIPVSHDATRLLTLATWICVAGLIGAFLLRVTRSGVVALIGFFASIQHLRPLADEPGHPQELCLLLLALLVLLAARWNASHQAWRLMTAAGVILAALTLTKINVGVYALLGWWTVVATFASYQRKNQLVLVAIGGAALPWLVMHAHADWSFGYAAIVSLGFLSVVALCQGVSSERPLAAAALSSFIAVAGATVLATCLFVMARGTSVAGLVTGLLIQPMGFDEIVFTESRFPPQAVIISALSFSLAVTYAAMMRDRDRSPAKLARIICGGKILTGVFGLALATFAPRALLGIGPVLLWVPLIRPINVSWGYSDWLPRMVLVSLASFQALHAYPIAGSQLAWATFLTIPAMLVSLADAIADAAAIRAQRERTGGLADRRVLQAVGLIGVILFFATRFDVIGARDRYASLLPLSLPGAERIRLPYEEARQYQWLVAQARQRCATLITLPGLNSLYFWTGLEPATGLNTTAWPALLDGRQQQEIVDAIQSRRGVCVIEYPAGIRTYGRDAVVNQQPLMRFVRDEFRAVEERDGYRVLVRE